MGSSPLARGLPVEAAPEVIRAGIIPARAGFTRPRSGFLRTRRDHPRSRGVYSRLLPARPCSLGSSPLARGLPPLSLAASRGSGIIPARAGFTAGVAKLAIGFPDHPRSRGVYPTLDNAVSEISGSSPLARGLRGACAPRGVLGGIIPARAGFTPRQYHPVAARPDHPRSRGVYIVEQYAQFINSGSSPLARGLLQALHDEVRRGGIIPARAGFTAGVSSSVKHARDHPRSRGVYSMRLRDCCTWPGSSPLARGLPTSRHHGRLSQRIIPARAGFTGVNVNTVAHWRDHPRSRGVYDIAKLGSDMKTGSSPLARGLRNMIALRGAVVGIIPARAGFTSSELRVRARARDHPRSRGVYYNTLNSATGYYGSSPLARGLQEGAQRRWLGLRIIPARAGFTPGCPRQRRGCWDHPRSRGVYT